jgi:hypothetical protein
MRDRRCAVLFLSDERLKLWFCGAEGSRSDQAKLYARTTSERFFPVSLEEEEARQRNVFGWVLQGYVLCRLSRKEAVDGTEFIPAEVKPNGTILLRIMFSIRTRCGVFNEDSQSYAFSVFFLEDD